MASSTASPLFDLYVIGGGINGTGIANDAAGRGLRAGLCEQNDLASATSSASSKLIHGGLRYLEHREFRLVREALREREVLLRKAPHIVWPMRFILPHRPHLRPAWMIRAGLFLYDHLGKRDSLAGSRRLRFDATSPLKPSITHGFEYSDCWVDDARLVVLNALQAHRQGAEILVRTRCIEARQEQGLWRITLEDRDSGRQFVRRAKVLVNAAGPWVESFIRGQVARQSRYAIRMIQGSHLVVPRINTDERAYILQNEDGRIVFVLPYQQDFSLIGTTDRRHTGDPAQAAITSEEIDYILAVVNDHFRHTLRREDVVATFCGIRPLCDDESADPSAMTRDYTLDIDPGQGPQDAPMLSVFGGKITTYRKLAEAALRLLDEYFPNMGPAWTERRPLPGGDIASQETFAAQLMREYPFLGEARARRYASSYGSLCLEFLRGMRSREEMGETFGADLTEAEVNYLAEVEWARNADDVLWRRSKLGLRVSQAERERLDAYLSERRSRQAA